MFRFPLLLFVFCPFVFVFTGCAGTDSEVQGSVFIVTKGAENYKLGLVKVSAIPESEIVSFIQNKKSTIGSETTKLKTDIDSVKSQIEAAQSNYDNLKREHDTVNNQKKELESQQSNLSSQYSSYMLSSCYSEYITPTPEMVEECRKQVRIGKQIYALAKQIASLSPRVGKAYTAMSAAETDLNTSRARMGEVLEKVKNYLTPAYLTDGLPEGKFKAVTDADGKFSMKLPRGKYAVFATAQRRVFSTTEEYHWLIWVDVTNAATSQVTLSNSNMLGEDTEDAVFKFNELIPSQESNKPAGTENVKV